MIYRLHYPISILIVWFSLQLASLGQTYPAFEAGQRITDVSNSLPQAYLEQVERDLSTYDFPVRVVYLKNTQGVKLGKYASNLFGRWKLPANEMLVVVALDRRKIGVHAGTELKNQLQESAPEVDFLNGEPEPIGTPLPGETRDPAVPLDVSSEFDHLELISEAVSQVKNDLQNTEKASKPSSSPLVDEQQAPSAPPPLRVEQEGSSFKLDMNEKIWIAVFIGVLVLGVLGVFALRFLKKWRKDQTLVDRFAVEGQAALGMLEQTDRSLEAVMPDLHGYAGLTEKNLNLFIKTMVGLRETYAEMMEDFDTEIGHLQQRQEREEAIDFFRELELKQEEGEQLHQQALNVLKNLKDVRQANQQVFEQSTTRSDAFEVEVADIKKNHVGLHLSRTQQIYRQHLLQLKALERKNEKDPLGVEKALKTWRKELTQIEQETRALPHLWVQFKQDLKQRVKRLQKAHDEKPFTPVDQKTLEEVSRMHQTLQSAIMQGDLKQLDRWNELFTKKLQDLESRY